MKPLTKRLVWDTLKAHADSIQISLNQQPADNILKTNASACGINIDYSHQRISSQTLEQLFALCTESNLREKIHALVRGDKVNLSQNRPALHTALRASGNTPIWVDGKDVMPDILKTRDAMHEIVDKIRGGQWLGFTGKPITDVVNIGIGGSDLGPRFCLKAFAEITTPNLNFHFISDIDPTNFKHTVASLKPETTLFIIASKSFTTQETLFNARKAFAWIGEKKHLALHCIAVTANTQHAQSLGISTILPIWDWVGGRFSLCSAINLITAIAIGYDAFSQMLDGSNSMDKHFIETDFSENLPVLLAVLGIWNNNFLQKQSLLLLTYSRQLEQFVPYIQQLDMESNGKGLNNQGERVNHSTGPLIWGGLGNQAQHSYYQLLCQGTHSVAADFITINTFDGELINDMCLAKIKILTTGVNELENPTGFIEGNLPLNHIRIKDCSPFSIGALISLYEHKIFTQSVIWDINPFDQPGVDSAKRAKRELFISETI